MKKLLIAFLLMTSFACKKDEVTEKGIVRPSERSYEFKDGVIPRNVLESYLSRSITQAEFLTSEGFFNDGPYLHRQDDVRMLKNIGAKFIGRAIYSWNVPENFNN